MDTNAKHEISSGDITHQMVVTNQMHKRMLDFAVKDSGMHRAQHRMLMTLAEGDFDSQVDIAEYLEVTPATIAVALKKLRQDGLIRQKVRKEDNRRNMVKLTDKGMAIVDEGHEFFASIDEQMYKGFTEEERKNLKDYLSRVYDNMEEMKSKMEG